MELPAFSLSDKFIHIFEYGILASLLYLGLRQNKVNASYSFGLAFAISFLYGISDEIHQYFVPGRQANIFDALADGLGALCFLLALYLKNLYRSEASPL